jgi:hypothetical protein
MGTAESRLEARGRRAYEIGRLRAASAHALPLVPLVALATIGCAAPHQVLVCGAGLLVAVTMLLWRGQEFGSGVAPGIAAGLLPLILPVLARAGGHPCTPAGCLLLPAVCALGGLAGGVLLGVLAPRPRIGRVVPFVVACSVAALTGAVGCLLYGLIGIAVMAAGLAVGALPLVAVRRV